MTVRIIEGDVRDGLAQLPDQSIQCCVTSPPYYGLRDYGVPGQLGLEPTLAEYIATMVEVFRDVRRVLRDDGTLWLNIGDSYAAVVSNNGGYSDKSTLAGFSNPNTKGRAANEAGERRRIVSGVKPKDLMMVPARLALALQDDGWYLRSDVIWHKPNPMPESVTDRPTSAHEHIFLLTKQARYYYDAGAIREENASPEQLAHNLKYAKTYEVYDSRAAGSGQPGNVNNVGIHSRPGQPGRNCRNVWTIATKPFSGAHFATFPPEIPRRCIRAGSRPGDTVLDPFGGSGTVGLEADRLGRDAILIELNPDYVAMARRRITGDCPLFVEVA